MVDPERVVEPVVAVILLQHLVISDLQEPHVLLIYAFVPDVIQDGHLLKVGARVEVRPGRRGDGGQAAQQQLLPASPLPPRRFRGHRCLFFVGQEAIFCRQDGLRLHLSFPEVQAWVVGGLGRHLLHG